MKNRHVAKYAMAQVDTLELMEKEYINQAGANWIPATSAFLFHTIGDEVVPFVNFENCLAAWKGSDKVKAFRCEGLTQSHVAYGTVFFGNDISTGIRAIFGNKTHNYKFEQTLGGI